MKLVYCWIEKNRSFEDFEINLCPEINFKKIEYVKELNKIEIKKLKGSENIISNYFGDNINLTAIVGENGSGKSSLINFILERINESNSTPKSLDNFIFIFELGQKYYLHKEIKKSPSIPHFKNLDVIIKDENGEDLNLEELIYSNDLFHNVYYNPIVSLQSLTDNKFDNSEKITNLSANSFISNSRELNGNILDLRSYLLDIQQKILVLQISFLREFKEFEMPFNFSKNLNVRLNLDIENFLVNHGSKALLDFYKKVMKYFFSDYNSEFNDHRDKRKKEFESDFEIILFFLELVVKEGGTSPSERETNIYEFKQKEEIGQRIKFEDWIDGEIEKYEIDRKRFRTLIDKFNEFKFHENEIQKFSINKFKNIEDFIKELFPSRRLPFSVFFNIEWQGLSSGELNFLNLFSSFSQAKYKGENIIIFIDECDLTFHVRWQQSYISYLIKGLTSLFPNKNIQIFLATHSPIILSDFPNSHVIFLQKDQETQKTKVSEKTPKTLAANIHDILRHDFFMEQSFMGEFVKNKINEVIFFLNYKIIQNGGTLKKDKDYEKKYDDIHPDKDNLIDFEKLSGLFLFKKNQDANKFENLEKFIANIDEPILKIKLNELYFIATEGSAEKGRLKAQQEIIGKRLKEL